MEEKIMYNVCYRDPYGISCTGREYRNDNRILETLEDVNERIIQLRQAETDTNYVYSYKKFFVGLEK